MGGKDLAVPGSGRDFGCLYRTQRGGTYFRRDHDRAGFWAVCIPSIYGACDDQHDQGDRRGTATLWGRDGYVDLFCGWQEERITWFLRTRSPQETIYGVDYYRQTRARGRPHPDRPRAGLDCLDRQGDVSWRGTVRVDLRSHGDRSP